MLGAWIWGLQAVASAGSLAVKRPWTAYASGRNYEAQVRAHPLFAQANQRITMAWTAYFAAAAAATAATGPLTGLALAAPTPVLAWTSYRYGNRFAAGRLRLPHTGEGPMTTDRQAELRTLIEGKTDDEILAAVLDGMGSYQAMIDETVEGMREAFDPEAAEDCVIGYEIATPEGDVPLSITIHDKTVAIEQRPADDARVVLGLSLPDYLRLINGLLDGTEAFMQGRLKLRGDVMFAPQLDRIFRRG